MLKPNLSYVELIKIISALRRDNSQLAKHIEKYSELKNYVSMMQRDIAANEAIISKIKKAIYNHE